MPIAMKLREGVAAEGRPEEVLPAKARRYAPRTRPHLCFVNPHGWPVFSGDRSIPVIGGAEVQQAILARLLAADGYRVSMICNDFGQPDPAQVDGVTVRRSYRSSSGIPVLRFLHPRLTTMWKRLVEVDADVYYYRAASMWVGVLAEYCRRYGKRLIYAGASDKDFVPDIGGQIRYARDRWLYRRGLAAADAIVAQNKAQQQDVRTHLGREAVLIPSVYEVPKGRKAQIQDCVLWVGTIHDGKRPEMLLELAKRLPHLPFVMIGGPQVGQPALFEEIRARAAALPNVDFRGFVPLAEIDPWFDRARVLVNTSRFEGMPNVFLQAWARGVPTVATVDVGVAEHRIAGEPEALAAELQKLYAEPRAQGEACRAYFERTHSSAEVLERYARLIDGIAP